MSFTFGNPAPTAAPTFGNSFGFSGAPASSAAPSFSGFGGSTATTAAPAFGGFGSTSTTPAFGGFGAATTSSAAPTFGGFGSTTTSAAPTFGGFGAPATSSVAPAFGGFGASTTSSAPAFGGFGAPATSVAPAFGGFGSTATSSSAPAFGGFGSSTTSTAPVSSTSTFGGFGGGTTTGAFGVPAASSSFGAFGTTTPSSGFGGFGSGGGAFGTAPQAGGTTGAFGGFGTAAGSTLGKPAGFAFGGQATTSSSSFAPSFGGGFTSTNQLGGGGGLFSQQPQQQPLGGGSFGAFGSFGSAQQPQQQQLAVNPVQQLYNSVLQCSVFGDERDTLLARWNMLQASWGIGKVFSSTSMPPLELSPENALCRFKTIGYSALPSSRNEDGLMSGFVQKKVAELLPQKAQISASIHGVFGNRPTIKVEIDEIRSVGSDTAEITFHLLESNPQTGQTKRVCTSEIIPFTSQPAQVQNFQKLGFQSVNAKVAFTEEQIKDYLDQPPQGIDPRLWKQAQLDNPDPKTLIPVPMIGFRALQQRIHCQDQQAKTYKSRLNAISDEIADLQKRHQDTVAALRDAKRRQLSLSHRVLHVMVKQEETRKIGFTIQPEEEKLRVQLEALQAEMSAPTQFKGRLNELLAKVRLQSQASAMSGGGGLVGEKHALDPYLLHDIKSVLKQQQQGIQALISLMKEDLGDLSTIQEELNNEASQKRKQF